MNDGPIFIGGLSFSGKTPLRMALSAHPRIAMTRHTALWSRFYGRFGDLAERARLESCLTAILADPDVAALQPDRDRLRAAFLAGEPTYCRLFGLVHEHHARRLGKARWGDQLGVLERHADLVLEAFPSATMLHLLRDPRDRLALAAPGGLRTPARTARQSARRVASAALARRNLRRHPGRYRVVRYEDLIARPEDTLRQLAAYLQEDYHPAMAAALGATEVGA